jgi:hypothetical protein
MLPEYGHSSAASASEQLYELIDGHAGVGDDVPHLAVEALHQAGVGA